MRKLILIIALTMVPLGIWTAGCRNDGGQAAFPDTPETRKLARTERESEVAAAAPFIPAKPIDREILHFQESDTLARIRAVDDRANRYASETAGRDMFNLPEERNYVASARAERPARAERDGRSARRDNAIPSPSAREFWSKPVARAPRANDDSGGLVHRNRNVPEDVSAMAAPAAPSGNGLLLPPPPPAARTKDPSALILPPDDMPGVFMVGEPDEAFAAPPTARRWPGLFRRDRGAAQRAAPLSAQSEPPRMRAEITQKSDTFPPIAPGARIVSSEGMDFEPLPEPIPLEQYAARKTEAPRITISEVKAPETKTLAKSAARESKGNGFLLPLPAELITGKLPALPERAPAAAPAIPELTETKATVETTATELKKALAPLPVLSPSAPKPAAVFLPPPVQESLPTPDETAAKAVLLDGAFESFVESGAKDNDFFKTDFWEPAAKTHIKQDAAVSAASEMPELSMPPLPPPAEPRKITLQPVPRVRAIPELEEIDAATEVPPLKF